MNISTTRLIRGLSAATLCAAVLSGFSSMPAGAAVKGRLQSSRAVPKL